MRDQSLDKTAGVSPTITDTSDNRLPSLDGLRAISIVLVFLGHLSGTKGFPRIYPIGDYAHLGVVVFFVISGYLITRLLLLEYARYGNVSLIHFYARRALRLLPATFAFILCITLMWAAGIVHLQSRDVWHALTYTSNYEINRSWYTGHLWSLSVEEQFYLLWPILFALLMPKRASWVIIGAIIAAPVVRAIVLVAFRGSPYRDLEMFPMVADSLAMGCLLAMSREWLEEKKWYLQLFKPVNSVGLLVLIFAINYFMGRGIVITLGTSVINLCLAILIHRSTYCYGDLLGQFLNWKPVAFVGVLSYSLYLWQQLFLNRNSSCWACAFPLNVVFAVFAALASYYLLEKPLLGLRHKLRIRQASANPVSVSLEVCQPR
jgi:peptidoglycan/LPS O-acetylase OafA/YrhL